MSTTRYAIGLDAEEVYRQLWAHPATLRDRKEATADLADKKARFPQPPDKNLQIFQVTTNVATHKIGDAYAAVESTLVKPVPASETGEDS